jgi:hypothetical protein
MSPVKAAVVGVLVLLGVLAVADFNVVFEHQSLVASANYHPFDDRFDRLKPRAVPDLAFANWHDEGATWWQWEPAAQFFSKALRRGVLPLWDPLVAGGVDAHTQLTSGQYFPPYVLLLALGNTPLQRDIYYLLELLTAGFCSFWLLRRNGFRMASSLAMGVGYMLGGTLTQNVNSVMGQSYAVLPFLVLVADWVAERPTTRRVALGAVGFAAATLASFMPVIVSGYVLIGVLALSHALVGRGDRGGAGGRDDVDDGAGARARVWRLAGCTAALGLGVCLVAFLLWPVHVMQVHEPAVEAWYHGAGLLAATSDLAMTLVSPALGYDSVLVPNSASQLFPLPTPFTTHFFYVGFIPLALACLARPGRSTRQRRIFWFSLVTTVLVGAKLFGIPPVSWAGYLPVFSELHAVPYFGGAFALGVGGLAACGLETVLERGPSSRDLAVVPILAAGLALWMLRFAGTHALNPAMTADAIAAATARMVAAGTWLAVLGLTLWGLLVWQRVGRVRPVTIGAAAVVVLAIELIPLHVHERFQRADVWRAPPAFVTFLQQDHSLFRVHSTFDLALTPNVAEGVGLASIGSRMTFNPPRYMTLIQTYFKAAQMPYPLPQELVPQHRVVLDLLNVKYLIAHALTPEQYDALAQQGFTAASEDGRFLVLRNATVWPRAYFTRQYQVTPTPEAALAAVGSLQPGEVILEEAPRLIGGPSAEAGGSIDAIRYDDNDVSLDVTADRPGLVVLDDNMQDGWRAYVDGRETPILHANYAFRAVEVPGRATVVFRYRTPGLFAGLAASGIALAIVLALAVIPVRRPRV